MQKLSERVKYGIACRSCRSDTRARDLLRARKQTMASVGRAARVRLRDESRDAVPYGGAGTLGTYLAALFDQMPLDTTDFEHVADFAAHRAHLARALVDVTAREPSDAVQRALDASPHARAQLLNYVWQLYGIAHRRAALMHGDGVAEAAWHAWALFMHAYLDAARRASRADQVATDALLTRSAAAFSFCAIAAQHSEPICVSADAPAAYSVRTHWQALSSAVTALYTFPYSSDMYDYVRTLVLRHALILAGPAPNGDDVVAGNDADEELQTLYDHPLYCTGSTGRPFLVGGGGRVLLNDLYLADTEVLLGAQMMRLARVRWLLEMATASATPDVAPTPRDFLDAAVAFCETLATHDVLRKFVVDPVREQLIGTLLLHGETRRFVRAHPRQEPVPDNVLGTMRQSAYKNVPVLLATPLAEIVRATAAALAAADTLEPHRWQARARPEHEAATVLILYTATSVWLQYKGASAAFVSARMHLEEMHIARAELSSPFALPPARPCLVRCMRWNFVLADGDAVRYAGTSLFSAYAAWLRALFFADTLPDSGRGTELARSAIHEAWRPLIGLAPSAAAVSLPAAAAGHAGSVAAFFA